MILEIDQEEWALISVALRDLIKKMGREEGELSLKAVALQAHLKTLIEPPSEAEKKQRRRTAQRRKSAEALKLRRQEEANRPRYGGAQALIDTVLPSSPSTASPTVTPLKL